ncbi:hypothetical protein PCANC_22793 [Puccinia coronata f. sp. avenae]|uniref:DUF6589 domain-containing protein n=1 Tax=Puccinia coronata f. sp. avenae TaxID=200324 RepID=A0A2N5U2Y3_9BASI|nr:hypothetical protein PCANC_22793 [Puccinia coronata f. sp. avenae]
MPTDQFLEVQNYWLKHFFNSSGTGTEIDRLKDVFSINIPILRYLPQLLKIESGSNILHQSHKITLTHLSLNSFIRMANKEDLSKFNPRGFVPQAIPDIYKKGIENLQEEFDKKADGLSQFKPYSPGILKLAEDQAEVPINSLDDLSKSDSSRTNNPAETEDPSSAAS